MVNNCPKHPDTFNTVLSNSPVTTDAAFHTGTSDSPVDRLAFQINKLNVRFWMIVIYRKTSI